MPTVDALQDLYQAQVAPGNSEEFLRLLTEADLRLLEKGRWRWTRSRVDLTPSSGIVTLPASHVSILAARVDKVPVWNETEEYEFCPDGIGEIEVTDAVGLRLIDQGLDDDGLRYYKVVGEDDDDDYTIHTLSLYAPLTLYYAAELPASPTVTQSSSTRCPSASALKLMMLAINLEEEFDLGNSSYYVKTALKVLDSYEGRSRGGQRQQVNVRPYGPGVRTIRNYR